jgi:adhesin transport system outer membrane protein
VSVKSNFPRVRTVLGLVLLGVGFAAAPAAAEGFTDALGRLLREHPRIVAAQKLTLAGVQREREAFGGFLPVATVTGETGPELVENNATRAAGEDFTGRRDRMRVSITQNLFNGFGDSARLRAAENETASSTAQLEATRQAVLLQGVSAYLNFVRGGRLIEIARLNEANIKNQLRLEDERVRRGAGITVDVLQAKSRLQIARERLVAFEGRLRIAAARYIQVFGQAPESNAMEDARPPANLLPSSFDEALAIARKNNPDAWINDFAARADEARREAAKSAYYPSVDLVGSAEYENDANGTPGTEENYAVFVRGKWEFFSGFRSQARVRAAARTLEASKARHSFSRRRVDESMRVAWENLATQRQRVDLLKNATQIAEEVLRARRRLRQAGKETALNVLDAEAEVFTARINLVDADYDARIAVYGTLRATGLMNEATLGLKAAEAPDQRPDAAAPDGSANRSSSVR